MPPGRDPTPRGNQGGREGGGGGTPPPPRTRAKRGREARANGGGDLHDTAEADLLQVHGLSSEGESRGRRPRRSVNDDRDEAVVDVRESGVAVFLQTTVLHAPWG